MASAADNKDQKHPQESRDRQIVNSLLQGQPDHYNLAELARLRIRYQNFPGAREIQRDLEIILQRWQLTEEQLYERSRQIHATHQIYKVRGKRHEQEDWS